jgi:hypothetical protein
MSPQSKAEYTEVTVYGTSWHFTDRKQPVKFPEAELITVMTMPMWNKKIGPTFGNGLATTGLIDWSLFPCSITYTAVNGDSIITSFYLP